MAKPKPVNPDQIGLTPEQCAERVPCSRTLIYDEIAMGRLVARKIGRRTVVLLDDLNEYMRNLPVAGGANRFRHGNSKPRNTPQAPEAA